MYLFYIYKFKLKNIYSQNTSTRLAITITLNSNANHPKIKTISHKTDTKNLAQLYKQLNNADINFLIFLK